jgi:hypothetical protein
MFSEVLNRDVKTLVGASGIMLDTLVVCGLVYVPVVFSATIVFDGDEKGPAPTPFIAATVKYVDDPAASPEMVWKESASTTICEVRTPRR